MHLVCAFCVTGVVPPLPILAGLNNYVPGIKINVLMNIKVHIVSRRGTMFDCQGQGPLFDKHIHVVYSLLCI